jgi:two-component system response regulator RpaA
MSVHEKIKEFAQAEATSVSHSAGRTTPARILLVEDDKALRRYLEVTLKQAGYEVIPAADGLQGMKLALASSVDIVVTDAMMPHLSGHEFCRFLRSDQRLSQIPIILLSGSEPLEGSGEKEIADAFLSKTVPAEDLKCCLEKLLKRSRGSSLSEVKSIHEITRKSD